LCDFRILVGEVLATKVPAFPIFFVRALFVQEDGRKRYRKFQKVLYVISAIEVGGRTKMYKKQVLRNQSQKPIFEFSDWSKSRMKGAKSPQKDPVPHNAISENGSFVKNPPIKSTALLN
jgi:hypothetical protein